MDEKMDGWIDEKMDGWMDGWMEKWMDKWTDWPPLGWLYNLVDSLEDAV